MRERASPAPLAAALVFTAAMWRSGCLWACSSAWRCARAPPVAPTGGRWLLAALRPRPGHRQPAIAHHAAARGVGRVLHGVHAQRLSGANLHALVLDNEKELGEAIENVCLESEGGARAPAWAPSGSSMKEKGRPENRLHGG